MKQFFLAFALLASPTRADMCRNAPPAPLPCSYQESSLGVLRACLDERAGMARWVAAWYQPSAEHQDRDSCVWRKTPTMPAPSVYAGTGYDKGHLIAFADIGCSENAASLTCQTGNIAPQPPQDNRTSWARFESRLRSWADTADKGAPIVFVAGPVLPDKNVEWVRPGLRKPTGFWKAALTEKGVCAYTQTFGKTVSRVRPNTLGLTGNERKDCPAP